MAPKAVGKIEAVLAGQVSDAHEPVAPASEFPEDAARIYLAVRSRHTEHLVFKARWIAVDAEGRTAGEKIGGASFSLKPDQRGVAVLEAPSGGFSPGNYRVDLLFDDVVEQSVPFAIVAQHPAAMLVEKVALPASFNVAARVLGGNVESSTSEYNKEWAAANLIDGGDAGWCSTDSTVPQEIVFSFYQGRETQIVAIVIDTLTSETIRNPDRSPKHVEIWVSTTSAADGFARVAAARLRQPPGEQVIALAPTRAKYVRLRFTSNYGGRYTQVAEVKILEAPGGPSILSDAPKNLALRAAGGAIVRFTSQRAAYRSAAHLIDGTLESDGWWSEPRAGFPQDIVFAFRNDLPAMVDRIVLNPTTGERSNWAKDFTVAVSMDTPMDGFQEVGQFTLAQEPRDHAFSIGRMARFVRVRILSNYGGSQVSLGEVQILEGTASGYRSILMEYGPVAATKGGSAAAATPLAATDVDLEKEPNDTSAEANALALGRYIRGTIDPIGEQDNFKIAVPGSGQQVLTVELLGRPHIRTSLALLNATGTGLKRFDPGRVPGQQAAFSWAVQPGDYTFRVTEPPISIVLIWDTSGSMSGSVKHLEDAMLATLDQVRPTERVNLIRFSHDVEVLLPEFTSDRDRMKSAVAGKFEAGGTTRFYDAVAKGIELLNGVVANRAIIVMTDGADSASKMGYAEFWRLLEQKRIRLYTIGLGGDLLKFAPDISTRPVRMLAHVAAATNGRFFFAPAREDLKGVYQQIVDELKMVSTYDVKATISRGEGGLTVAAVGERLTAVTAPSQIELILDASGSMKQRVDGRQKIDVAKEVVTQIIKGLPDDARVALRVYGHRIREGRPGDCKDSELLFPFGKVDKSKMIARVHAIQALGTTPIEYSLRQVAADFGNAPGEKMIILVTDGKEECRGDPAAAVSELLAKGLKFRLNIVGFALADAATKRDMERVAKMTGGMFFDATNARALTQAIQQALAVPYEVLDAAGARVAGGLTGQGRIDVPEGVYSILIHAAGQPIMVPGVRVTPGAFTKVVLKKEGREIGVQVQGP